MSRSSLVLSICVYVVIVFFFQQKTAYEMRISDWSSDVCSSDLGSSCLRLTDSKEGDSVRPIGLPVVECLEERGKEEAECYVFPGERNGAAFGSFQIGRASCRERVGQ